MEEKVYLSLINGVDDSFEKEIEEHRMIAVGDIYDADIVFIERQSRGLLAETQFRDLVKAKELNKAVLTFYVKAEILDYVKEQEIYRTRENMDMEME